MFKAIGLMTGSSMDGIDGALIETDGLFYSQHISGASIDYSSEFKILLRICEYAVQQEKGNLNFTSLNFKKHMLNFLSENNTSATLNKLENYLSSKVTFENIRKHLTILHSQIVDQLIEESGIESVDIIGFHGQNLYHKPEDKITIQMSDGQFLADMTNTKVVTNFRAQDVSSGGQGAPLAPMYHRVLASMKNMFPIAFVNCGGISNISYIKGLEDNGFIGFDTGPGNVLIDKYIRHKTSDQEFMDLDGKYGINGAVNHDVIALLYSNSIKHNIGNFFTSLPPKSLDYSNFFLIEEILKMRIEDASATLEYFTADSILNSFDFIDIKSLKSLVLCGGGWNNPVIKQFFIAGAAKKFPSTLNIITSDELGWKSKYIEAEIFGYLAVRSKLNLPTSLPNITGVRIPTVGGNLHNPHTSL